MGKVNPIDVLNAVQKDNLKAFLSLYTQDKGVLKLCYGRFPLLSVCYLFKARKIVKNYEKQLNAVSVFNYVPEDARLYTHFKRVAGKSLRLYTDECIITPVEMLALTGENEYLSASYARLEKSEQAKNNITKIYQARGQSARVSDQELCVPKTPLSRLKKMCVFAAAIIAIVMIICPLAFNAVVGSFGKGTEKNPFVISNGRQLALAFKSDNYYTLKNNITLPDSFTGGDFSGTLDGGGKTIYVNKPKGAIINKLTGIISNVNFVFADFNAQITGDTSFIASTNSGVIFNVNVDFKASLTKASSDEARVAVFAVVNSGEITDCTLFADINFNAAEGGASVAGFCVLNEGKIEGCATKQGSKIITDTADIGGIACGNVVNKDSNGEILNCVNNAELKQTTSNAMWFAMVAGIVLENYYYVYNCVNNGQITVESLGLTKDIPQEFFDSNPGLETLMAYVGGIAYLNDGTIEKCKNNADIKCYSNDFCFYVGGIVAANLYRTEKSCYYGTILVSCANSLTYHYVGGIASLNYSAIRECYTVADFPDNQSVMSGGIVAWHNVNNPLVYTSNYYVSGKELVDVNLNGVIVLQSVDELKILDIYWG